VPRTIWLAWRYLAFHRIRTAVLVGCVALTVYLPAAMHLLVQRFQTQLLERAETTPLVVGAKGSRFDLALHALYFEADVPDTINALEADRIRDTGFASPIPLLVRYRARGFAIVGTSLDYFTFRDLRVARGTPLVRLGDCVLGARVARKLRLEPGERLLSDPENVFDIAGNYPLNMRVTGILAESHSPDDFAVFVDVKTAWVIAGIGHGHQDIATTGDENVILRRTQKQVVANAALPQYTEITEENLGSFHFHGNRDQFPLTAMIAVPRDEKSGVLLTGRYQSRGATSQILTPSEVVRDLMQMVFRVKRFFDLAALLIAIVTLSFLGLVVLLSLRLRKREMETMYKLGSSRFTVFKLQAAELCLIALISAAVAAVLVSVTSVYTPWLIRQWLFLA
jgi:putative ABC transport system permease protein